MKIGCHVSIAGGVENAPSRAFELGCETFQIFTRSPQGAKAAPLAQGQIGDFNSEMQKFGFEEFVVHAPYFVNFGSAQARVFHGSVSIIQEQMERAALLGARFLMAHLGTYKDVGEEKGSAQVVKGLRKALQGYSGDAKFLLEIAAGAGAVIGSSFKQLGAISGELEDLPGFGGICFDTQHAFASGYPVNTPDGIRKTFEEFDSEIGLSHLRMSHVNDSKIPLGGKRDRHEHIGAGNIGDDGFAEFFKFIAGLEAKTGSEMPLILETEHDKVKEDIEALKRIRSALNLRNHA